MDHAIAGPAWTAFDRLGSEARRALRDIGAVRAFERGALVLVEGTETPFLGSLQSGRIALRLRTPELGGPVTIATIEPGDLLGWSAVVAPFRTTSDAVATEAVEVLAFDAATLREHLAADPGLAAQLLPAVIETVARRLTSSWHQLIDLFEPRSLGPW